MSSTPFVVFLNPGLQPPPPRYRTGLELAAHLHIVARLSARLRVVDTTTMHAKLQLGFPSADFLLFARVADGSDPSVEDGVKAPVYGPTHTKSPLQVFSEPFVAPLFA